MVDYYQILGIPQSAGYGRIKEAFKKLALTYHPDRNPGNKFAEEKFKQINEAYQTLSDPEKRAKYDLIFKYSGRGSVLYEQQPRYSRSYKSPRTVYNPFQAKPNPYGRYQFGWTYFKHQVFAFAFVFAVAVLVLAFQAFYNNQLEIVKQRKEEIMRQKLAQAMVFYNQGYYRTSLDSLISLIREFPGEYEIRHQREEVVKKVGYVAENQLKNKEYEKAMKNFKIVKDFQVYSNFDVEHYIAMCYQGMGKYEEAAKTLEFMLVTDYQNIELKIELASLYLHVLDQPEKALGYFTSAKNKVKQILEVTYGKAYEFVINPTKLPKSYFEAYYGCGLANQKLENHGEAIKDFNWAIYFNATNGSIYHYRGLSFLNQNRPNRACQDFTKALELGYINSEEQVRNHCDT